MKLEDLQPTKVFETYWPFAAERHSIYVKRLRGEPQPWTSDEDLRKYKFTNIFRVADRVSQHLIRSVIYAPDLPSDPEEVVFRILLFKFFNRISTWEEFVRAFGIPSWRDFDERAYVRVLDQLRARGEKIFSGAYQHNDLSNYARVSPYKHPRYLRLLRDMMQDKVAAKLRAARTYREAFEVLHRYPLHEDFIAMQHLTDINYSEVINFSEDDFIRAGPGARKGLRKCFEEDSAPPGSFGLRNLPSAEEAAAWITDIAGSQELFFEHFGLKPPTLFGRRLSLIDVQNVFCETNKLARVKHPEYSLPKEKLSPKRFEVTGPLPKQFFPPKWQLRV